MPMQLRANDTEPLKLTIPMQFVLCSSGILKSNKPTVSMQLAASKRLRNQSRKCGRLTHDAQLCLEDKRVWGVFQSVTC